MTSFIVPAGAGTQRAQLELYVRWMGDTRRYKPSTVSRRTSVLSGFCRTAVIEGVFAHSPAGVRPPTHRPTRVAHTWPGAPSV